MLRVRKETNRRKEKCSIHTRELKRKNQIDNFHQTTYREMYINSHVPQLIASPTGSIISCTLTVFFLNVFDVLKSYSHIKLKLFLSQATMNFRQNVI